MKKIMLGVAALLCMVTLSACGTGSTEGTEVEGQNCNPKTGVCVGGPTSTPCGNRHQVCCGVNGWAYDCLGSDVCNPALYECVAQWVPCTVTCYTLYQTYYPSFQVAGSATSSQVYALALSKCDSVPGSQYISYSCTY